MKYLLDTNICIALIRQKPKEIIKKLTSYRPGDIGISAITIAELIHGAQKSKQVEQNMTALDQFLLPLEVVDFDQNAAVAYGHIRTHLENKGALIGSMDMLIAAHARSLDVALVTNNTREFKRIPDLKLEDWMA
ncbi:MAG TPA: type II toxin-antitoxin system VapC family toxin [Anaerolineales bacterium]|jgi:tRNA(fMet)-specific endonuclease VapC|nr:type II toxin-antitoxin system VapC family toxin [Anaerolineales bacterium]